MISFHSVFHPNLLHYVQRNNDAKTMRLHLLAYMLDCLFRTMVSLKPFQVLNCILYNTNNNNTVHVIRVQCTKKSLLNQIISDQTELVWCICNYILLILLRPIAIVNFFCGNWKENPLRIQFFVSHSKKKRIELDLTVSK